MASLLLRLLLLLAGLVMERSTRFVLRIIAKGPETDIWTMIVTFGYRQISSNTLPVYSVQCFVACIIAFKAVVLKQSDVLIFGTFVHIDCNHFNMCYIKNPI